MKKIILGVSASIAAYKAYDLTRLFVKEGFSVFNLLTENSLNLVSPLTFETLSGNRVFIRSFSGEQHDMGHISLKENASLFLVAPATADVIGKFASGIADDLLTTTYLSVECPVLIAPAMNPVMYNHPAVVENCAKLKERGVRIVEPSEGDVICGDEGRGKLADIEDIFRASLDVIKG